MPVVLRMDGFVFRVNTHDHPPPHVHVRVAGTVGALEIARTCQAHLLSEWRNYHGGDH